MTNLIACNRDEIAAVLAPWVDRPFRLAQIAEWILSRHARSFDEMTDLPLELRNSLDQRFSIQEPRVVDVHSSGDGCRKYLLELDDRATVECVAMPGRGKLSLCLSSQTGCALGCTFCVTGALGAGRNLSAEEIVGQYRMMLRHSEVGPERVNLVFMGMGEPLLNTAHLERALRVFYERVSPRRITISTAGLVPGIRWFAGLDQPPKLALSLNAPDQERRAAIMPVARRYPLDQLMAELRALPLARGRRITFEYVLIRGFNDQAADALAVASLLRGIPAKVNLIPLNPDATHIPAFQPPDPEVVDIFGQTLRSAHFAVTVRNSRGQDVAGACGQLRARVVG